MAELDQKKTIAALFDTYEAASLAVVALEDAGIPAADISIVSNNVEKPGGAGDAPGEAPWEPHGEPDGGIGSVAAGGAGIGSIVGGGAGLLASLGLLAIPGIGPVAAAGWLAATLTGAATGAVAGGLAGGLVGALTRAGIEEKDANIYAEGIRRGSSLVSVRSDARRVGIAGEIFAHMETVDLDVRADLFRDTGWRQFDEEGRANTEEELARARQDPRMPML